MKKVYLALEEIETNGLQTRAQLNMDVVREYAEAEAERGAVFPPVTVFSDGAKHWLADGFHRVAMARQQGKKKIAAEVREGDGPTPSGMRAEPIKSMVCHERT